MNDVENNLTPRNSLVLIRLFKKAEDQRGKIIVPTGQDEYCEGEVLAVGPGVVAAAGGRSETFDLEPGQRVLVQYRTRVQNNHGMTMGFRNSGLSLRTRSNDGSELMLFEQANVLATIDDSEPFETVPKLIA